MAVDHDASPKEVRIKKRKGERRPEAANGEIEQWPPWLRPLLSGKFFVPCAEHDDGHRRERNMFCIDCASGALCQLCVSIQHCSHRTLQIRRSSYHDVARLSELPKALDVSGVQTYIINAARVVFLNERPQHKAPGKNASLGASCRVCSRGLLDDNFRFCSIGCKVSALEGPRKKKMKKCEMEADEEGSSSSCTTEAAAASEVELEGHPIPMAWSYRSRERRRRRKGSPHRAALW